MTPSQNQNHQSAHPAYQRSKSSRTRVRSASKTPRMRRIHLRRHRLRTSDVTVVERSTLQQAIGGTVVGNFMEWYDFGVYGYLAVTMTSVFTKGLPQNLGLLVMLLGFAVSFLVRPVGGVVLGPLGDRIGRQKVLFFTMGLMAVSTALIGVLPTAAQIGAWSVAPLYALKMLQGFSTGGEYAGATTYISEFSPDKKRGYYSAWLDMGSYLGSAFGAATVAVVTMVATNIAGPNAMVDWGWRVPYLLTIPLGFAAIMLRTRIPETPQFADHMKRQAEESAVMGQTAQDIAQATQSQAHDPEHPAEAFQPTEPKPVELQPLAAHDTPGTLRYVIHHHWRELLTSVAIVAATNTAGYVLTSYMPTYLEEEVGTSTTMAAAATVPVLIIMSLSLPLIGRLSDRIGRKPVYAVAIISTLVLMMPAFRLLHTGDFWAIQLALALIAIPVAFYAGVSASTLPALFPTDSRFGGMGLSYNLAVSVFGGTTPLVSQALIQLTGNHYMPGIYIMVFGFFSAIAVIVMKESSKSPLPGSLPSVGTKAEAVQLVRTQDENPLIDTTSMPMPLVTVEIPAGQNMPQQPEAIRPVTGAASDSRQA